MRDRLRPAHRQGTLALVLIASASGLVGCSEDPNNIPVEVSRAQYTTIDDCVQDWGSESACEYNPNGMDGQALSGGQTTSGAHASHSGGHWRGPWYSRAGTVYHYDGRVEPLRQMPSHASTVHTQIQTANQIYSASSGRYATTPAHAKATSAKIASGRGGFGGTGRHASSGGG